MNLTRNAVRRRACDTDASSRGRAPAGDEQAEEAREDGDAEEQRDQQRPGDHLHRVLQDAADAGEHGRDEIDIAVDQQRKGDDRDREHEHGDHRAERIADKREEQAPAGRENSDDQFMHGRNVQAVEHQEHEDREIDPDDEREDRDQRHPAEILARARPDGAEHPAPAQRLVAFERARDFVCAGRDERHDQRETHGERIADPGQAQRQEQRDSNMPPSA